MRSTVIGFPPYHVFSSEKLEDTKQVCSVNRQHIDPVLGEEVAMKLVELEPQIPAPLVILSSIYAALEQHIDPVLGEEVAMKLVELEPQIPAPFVILSSIYAALE
ncbi:hypothetical protein F2Q70_00018201 [Brassica cretica]|uniref:Uncharacterized protein n=1 Tax=Brassica cretica TaxID=69181 RepID=A0A8S9I459_BRACR|nr:hypothetical protein F2Q70_00018201 [Brassica cretica]